MVTGTEGNDNLTNDPAVDPETIDALGGDDVITVNRPNLSFENAERLVTVNGGDGFDTLIVNAGNYLTASGSGFDGSLRVREGNGIGWTVAWSSIERLEINGGRFFSTNLTLGDEIDIVRLDAGFGGSISTTGGNDEIYISGTSGGTRVRADGGVGDDLIDLSGMTSGGGGLPHEGVGGEGNDILRGGGYSDVLDGGAGNDNLYLHQAPAFPDNPILDTALGGSGNDNIFFGATLTQYDVVTGGEGTDTLVVQGNYAGGLTLSTKVTEIENLSILGGDNIVLGETGANRYDYVVTVNDANFAAGVQARINGSALLAGEDFTFNGSAETDALFVVYGGRGTDTLTGGQGNDIFFFAEERFASGDTVNGGAGYNGMFLRGNYTIDFNAPGYTGLFTNIHNLTLTSATDERYARGGGTEFDYNLTLSDAIVGAGQTLTVSGALLLATETMVFDASQESNGALRLFGGKSSDTLKGGALADLLHGNLGADTLAGNGGADAFRYQNVAESTSGSMDQILDFTAGTDKIELDRIDADSTAAGNQAFAWIGSNAFTGSAGQLRAYEQGGSWFVEGDVNGDGVADLVIALTLQGPAPLGAGDLLL